MNEIRSINERKKEGRERNGSIDRYAKRKKGRGFSWSANETVAEFPGPGY